MISKQGLGDHILLYTNKHTLDIQINHFAECFFGMFIKSRSPSCSSIREQDVYMVGLLLNFFDQSFHFAGLGEIGGYRVCFARARECVERLDRFFAGFGFAGCDEDFGAAGLEETLLCISM